MAEKDLTLFYTGAATEGDAAVSAAASIGGKRTSTRVKAMTITPPGSPALTGFAYTDASPACGEGNASLAFTLSNNTLTFTAPGDTAGQPVSVAAGGAYEVYSGTATKWIIVTCPGSLPAANASDALALAFLNEAMFDTLGSGAAQAGKTSYRGYVLKNTSAYTMYGAIAWLSQNTPFTQDAVQIGLEAVTSGGIQALANETTAPAGVTFYDAASEGAALSIGNLAAGGMYGIWIKRVVTATNLRYANNNFVLSLKADTV